MNMIKMIFDEFLIEDFCEIERKKMFHSICSVCENDNSKWCINTSFMSERHFSTRWAYKNAFINERERKKELDKL